MRARSGTERERERERVTLPLRQRARNRHIERERDIEREIELSLAATSAQQKEANTWTMKDLLLSEPGCLGQHMHYEFLLFRTWVLGGWGSLWP